jgi:gamma-aminobutyric acid receptor subunit alpha
MTFLGLEARTDLPKVNYPTALDFFVFLSFVFIFATILQFAFVHFFTKYGSGECYYNYYETSSESESDDNEAMTYFPQSSAMSTTSHVSSMSQIEDDMYGGVIPLSRLELDIEMDDTRSIRAFKSFRRFIGKYILCLSYFENDTQSQNDGSQVSINNSTIESEQPSEVSTYTQNTPRVQRRQMKNSVDRDRDRYRRTQFNSVSKIDKFSRFFFPLLFFIINVFYWSFYLTRSQTK